MASGRGLFGSFASKGAIQPAAAAAVSTAAAAKADKAPSMLSRIAKV